MLHIMLCMLIISEATGFSTTALLNPVSRLPSVNTRRFGLWGGGQRLPTRGSIPGRQRCNIPAMLAADGEAYNANPETCLRLTFELDLEGTESPLRAVDEEALAEASRVVCKTIGTVKEGDLVVEMKQAPECDSFSAAHSGAISPSYWVKPVTVELLLPEDETKVFVRTTTNLEAYDGVGAMHAAFNVIEYLEKCGKGGKIGQNAEEYLSAPLFKSANKAPEFDPKKMEQHEKRLEAYAAVFDAAKGDTDGALPVGPPRAATEDGLKPRVYTRVSEAKTPFKDFVGIAAAMQKRLGFENTFYTVNFSPQVCLGVLPEIAETLDHQKRQAGIFTPKGAPLPMNVGHAEMLSYGTFWNNYGRHEPKFCAKVKGFVWNWTGLPKCFAPTFWCATVQGRSFFMLSLSERDQRACQDLFDKIEGDKQPFAECKQPVRSK
mmetsp:Transcript_36428/g.93062  ORF Transcript_36428/g.93062 Transcript_36428/m.93062 type:complete len:434 (-) Transcript_36428:31-1332(-)